MTVNGIPVAVRISHFMAFDPGGKYAGGDVHGVIFINLSDRTSATSTARKLSHKCAMQWALMTS